MKAAADADATAEVAAADAEAMMKAATDAEPEMKAAANAEPALIVAPLWPLHKVHRDQSHRCDNRLVYCPNRKYFYIDHKCRPSLAH